MGFSFSKNSFYSIIMLCGLTHLVIDAASVNFYFKFLQSEYFKNPHNAYLLYGISAFVIQPILGFLSDLIKKPILGTICGCAMVALGPVLSTYSPIIAFLCLCLGNAIFHVNGGILILSLSAGKAATPGSYVAPGTIGVMVGTILGLQNSFPGTTFATILAIAIILILIAGQNYKNTAKSIQTTYIPKKSQEKPSALMIAVLLFFACIIMRSIVGTFTQTEPLRSIAPAFYVPIAVFLGKGIGGFWADKVGWHVLGVGSLLLSAPILFMTENFSLALVFGLFLFNMTMPITLAAVSNLLPEKPGFAFGLTALGIFVGAIAVTSIPYTAFRIFFVIILAALLFHIAMRQYNESFKS